jgi:hypothetical protein
MRRLEDEVKLVTLSDPVALDWLRRYQWLRSGDRSFEEWDAMRTLHGITLDAYIDQKMGYDDAH